MYYDFPRPYQHEITSPRAQQLFEFDRNRREATARLRTARKTRRAKWLGRPDLKRS